jgi:hypothetical protein
MDTGYPWIQLDLNAGYLVGGVSMFVTSDNSCCIHKMGSLEIRVGNTDASSTPQDAMIR